MALCIVEWLYSNEFRKISTAQMVYKIELDLMAHFLCLLISGVYKTRQYLARLPHFSILSLTRGSVFTKLRLTKKKYYQQKVQDWRNATMKQNDYLSLGQERSVCLSHGLQCGSAFSHTKNRLSWMGNLRITTNYVQVAFALSVFHFPVWVAEIGKFDNLMHISCKQD